MLVAGRRREKIWLAETAPVGSWPAGRAEIALDRSPAGHGGLVARAPEPVATAARWTERSSLRIEGLRGAWTGPLELVLHAPGSGVQHAFAATETPDGGFAGELQPAAIESLSGPVALRQGPWHLCARPAGVDEEAALAPIVIARELLPELPLTTLAGHKAMSLGAMAGDRGLLTVERDLDDDERGTFHQRRLVRTAYAPRRAAPLRDAVVYASFGGRQCSDSPLAIHAELLRRDAALEHLWVVHDGMVPPPAGAGVLRAGSREHLEALATARCVVANDHFPDFFEPREDQVVLQTWHGTPFKRLGLDVTSSAAPTQRRFEGAPRGAIAAWQHVLSPNPHTTEILRRALGVQGAIHETGYPRNDVLAEAGRDERSRAVRERLGLSPGARVVLYAPTFRDHVIDRRGRPRLDMHLDADVLRAALGEDTVVLFRKHHLVIDPVPVTDDGFVRDVTTYPDANELMLAADVLVSDYSAMLFDFALTGRPMVVFAYDLETYRDEVRGLYLDPETELPGPVVRTNEQLAAALGDLGALASAHAGRLESFRRRFCALEDGRAAERAADLLVGPPSA
jgi:CDP-glycerol glycerophosphotransferase